MTTPTQESLQGLTAIITGGAKGIGLGIAHELAAAGMRLALWDSDEAALQSASNELRSENADVTTQRVDITQPEQVQEAVSRLVETNGAMHVLVNNAGIGGDKLVTKLELDEWKKVLDVNITAQFVCVKAVVPHMMQQGFGRIINIGSRAWLGNRGQASYSASKGAVVSFTRTLALEFARNGITANAIAPGIVQTPLFSQLKPEVVESLKNSVPMQRIGEPEDIARAVRFFAEPSSSYVTGQLLYVCGGRSLSSPSV